MFLCNQTSDGLLIYHIVDSHWTLKIARLNCHRKSDIFQLSTPAVHCALNTFEDQVID